MDRREVRESLPRTAAAVAAAALMLTATLALGPAPGAEAFHADLPLAFEDRREGDASWGIRVDRTAEGDIGVDVLGEGPFAGSRLTMGAVLFDQDRTWRVMFTVTFLTMPERTIVSPAPPGEPVPPAAVQGEPGRLPRATFRAVGGPAPGAGADEGGSGSAAPGAHLPPCPADACFVGTIQDAPPGPTYLIVWMAGVGATRLEVHGDDIADVAARPGAAYAVGDPEIRNGDANVQVQRTVCETRPGPFPTCPAPGGTGASYDVKAGVKAVTGAHVDVEAEQEVWGHFGATDFKFVCQFEAGECPHQELSGVEFECTRTVRPHVGEHCGKYHVSYVGPDAEGHGQKSYTFLGLQESDFEKGPPGAYSFRVDAMADAYGPRVFDPNTRTFVFLGEHFGTLTLADVSLPP